MQNEEINIDFDALIKSMRKAIREKAIKAGSSIIYNENNQLIKENPATGEKSILKTYSEPINA